MKEELMHVVNKDKKKLLILSIIALMAVFLLIVGSGISPSDQESEEVNVELSDMSDAETELEQLLGSMVGVGNVDVIISYDGEVTEQYAYNEERTEVMKEDGSTEIREKREMVLTDGDGAPVVAAKEHPSVKGVLVSAEGASDDTVREALVNAVASYLDIGVNRICITAMEV
ncbi:MAG: hypothetical protein IJF43_07310, partial [Firmicutes bacterium]|nr:hypothetical protein [Bacillota bacterium]